MMLYQHRTWRHIGTGQYKKSVNFNPFSQCLVKNCSIARIACCYWRRLQIDISSNSREIKYPNIGRTHRHTDTQTDTHTDRQTGWKQYLATPSGGEVTRQPEMANTSPRHMPVLGNVHPTKIEKFDIFRDVISLLARVFIFLFDRATQEVPMQNIWKKLYGPDFEIYAIKLLGSMSTDEAWRHIYFHP